jgi:hypothetical protein
VGFAALNPPYKVAHLTDMLFRRALQLLAGDKPPVAKAVHRFFAYPTSAIFSEVFDMAQNDTLIVRAALEGKVSIYRDIDIEASKSLYKLAEAIISSFDFDFDHAFGFYSGLTPTAMMRSHPRYELFADLGNADPGVLGVKKTPIVRAFPAVGHVMLFLFDYGDEWRFRVKSLQTGKKLAKVRYPRVVATHGEAPAQYPDPDDDDHTEDEALFEINVATGEKIIIRK